MCLLKLMQFEGSDLDIIDMQSNLFLFHCIQNEVCVLLSIWFIKIGCKLMEIRSPEVDEKSARYISTIRRGKVYTKKKYLSINTLNLYHFVLVGLKLL
jgi:hypothetical protein